MNSTTSTRRKKGLCVIILIVCFTYITHRHYNTLYLSSSACFEWKINNQQSSTKYSCSNSQYINTFIWTHDGTGLMKYIQWIRIRKLGNIILSRLDDNCKIIQQNNYSSSSIHKTFIQIYILSLYTDQSAQSDCLRKINQTLIMNKERITQIYFTRKSIKATVLFQQLEQISKFPTDSLKEKITKASYTIKLISDTFSFNKMPIINSEDLIHSDLFECEKRLTNFFSLLKLNIPKHILEYDSHHFLEDATWWDRSEVAEQILNGSIPSPPSIFTYTDDFYHLHGNGTFLDYLSHNRRCANEGIFSQMQSETISNRTSTDIPNRCLSKPYDCAFSDIYSFNDREELYKKSNEKPLKCGFVVPTIFDGIRKRYARNQTCETIVYTVITGCYDPLPIVRGVMSSTFCFVALLDTKTVNAQEAFYQQNPDEHHFRWNIISLGNEGTPFSVAAKSTETLKVLGQRLFPLAKWIVWVDGKAHVVDINQILIEARAPVIGAGHDNANRTTASELIPTITRLRLRENALGEQFNNSLRDIELQRREYERDEFYVRSDALGLKMIDIGIFIYRNNHPCITRYLCAWHNEINYYSFRGQLSLFYPAVRLNLTDYFHYIAKRYFFLFEHRSIC